MALVILFTTISYCLVSFMVVLGNNQTHNDGTVFPCTAQYTMKPNLDGKGLDVHENPPPFTFTITNLKGKNIRYYKKNNVYAVSLVSKGVSFRSALLQARLSTRRCVIIGHLRSGEFLYEEDWEKQGLKIQKCPLVINDSLITTNLEDKTDLRVKWKPHSNDGSVQFVISIVNDDDVFWRQWAPKNGLLLPSTLKTSRKKGIFDSQIKGNHQEIKFLAPSIKIKNFEKGTDDDSDRNQSGITVLSTFEAVTPGTPETNVLADNKNIFNVIKPSEKVRPILPSSRSGQMTKTKNHCATVPCQNKGLCINVPSFDKYECTCAANWTGLHCEFPNFCAKNRCQNGAICLNAEKNYTCDCSQGWAGQFCDKPCPVGFCLNGGTCSVDASDRAFCICKTGYVGDRCETDFDECASNPCLHGSTCVDRLGRFECQCTSGLMGERCHRPCQDIYKSCEFWEEQDRCESMRPSTKFFDINCAFTCGQCTFDNSTVISKIPLPPILESLEFLIGKWVINNTSQLRYPVDFPAETTKRYYQFIEFSIPNVAMFGTPSINYADIAQSIEDPEDFQITVGYLSLNAAYKPIKASLMSVSNAGLTLVEEGEVVDTTLKLKAVSILSHPLNQNPVPIALSRVLRMEGAYLQETFQRSINGGESTDSSTKYYYRQT